MNVELLLLLKSEISNFWSGQPTTITETTNREWNLQLKCMLKSPSFSSMDGFSENLRLMLIVHHIFPYRITHLTVQIWRQGCVYMRESAVVTWFSSFTFTITVYNLVSILWLIELWILGKGLVTNVWMDLLIKVKWLSN